MAKEIKNVKGYLSLPTHIKEAFKSEVEDKEATIPKKVGAAHPYDFRITEGLYKSYGFVTGMIDKHVDSIVGNFSVKAKNENVQTMIEDFIQNTNFQVYLRSWIRSACITGNGFMEIDLENTKVKVIDSKQMFVRRNKKGEILGYNQVLADGGRVSSSSLKEPIKFTPGEIAHVKINCLPNDPYGIGIIKPNLRTIDNIMQNEMDQHKVVSRKAGSPYHVKVGIPGEMTSTDVVNDFASKLQYLNNATEWTTDANVEIKTIDFGDLGKGFDSILLYDRTQLLAGFQVPEVLMGSGQLNEGIAKVQLKTFKDERIRSLREEIEKVIEENIFQPLLKSQENEQFNEHVEFQWDLPGEEEKNARIEKLSTLISSAMTSENLKRMCEIEIAKALNIEDCETFLREPEVGLDDQLDEEKKAEKQAFMDVKNPTDKTGPNSPEAKKESKIKQPEVPGAKPSAKAMHGVGCGQQIDETHSGEMSLQEWVYDPRLKEMAGFKYSDYVSKILSILKNDPFSTLKAITETDLALGLLPNSEIDKLREIFKSGFKKNQTLSQIQKQIEQNIPLDDRLKINENGDKVLVATAKTRYNSITRTEASRLSNKGLVEHYKDNKIPKVRFLAALSDRTCPICEDLNGNVYLIQESAGIIPVHVGCRCTWIPVTG